VIRVGFTRSVDDNYEALVILDGSSGDVIEFQRSLTHDAQDVALGQDTYAVVRGEVVHYGGLDRFSAVDGRLALEFDAPAARALDLPQRVEIGITEQSMATIVEHLPRIVGAT
jgi:hypothetical protein